MTSNTRIIHQLLDSGIAERQSDHLACQTMDDWHRAFATLSAGASHTMDRAMLGGLHAPSVGFAFMAGYQSAIEALMSDSLQEAKQQPLSALCISEAGGNHPRAIETLLDTSSNPFVLRGQKTFVSGGCDAKQLYIAAKVGESTSGLPHLKMISLNLSEYETSPAGLEINAMPSFSFVPDITHGMLRLDGLTIDESQVLAGDAYSEYIKPFRTIEDLHVQAGILSYLLGRGLQDAWPKELIQAQLATLVSLKACFELDPRRADCHIVLAGIRADMDTLMTQSASFMEQTDLPRFQDWERDKAILAIAKKAHVARTDKAWSHYQR